MRVVLDTNILTRVFASPHGPAGELLDRIAAEHVLVVSPSLLVELGRVLGYDRLRRLHQRSDSQIHEFVDNVQSGAAMAALAQPLPSVVPHDPDDDLIVATAVAGRADVLCTRNRHLFHQAVVEYCRSQGIEIMDDLTLLERLRSASDAPDEESD